MMAITLAIPLTALIVIGNGAAKRSKKIRELQDRIKLHTENSIHSLAKTSTIRGI